MIADIIVAIVLVLGVPALLVLAVRWIRSFAELFWLLVVRPRIIAASVLLVLWVTGVALRILFCLPPMGSLAFSLSLVLIPFVAAPLGNYIAYRRRAQEDAELGWKGFIFEERRLQQRRMYEAPRSEQG